tara:strand:+ start:15352 stop:15627 length:276 start_codon:yes stop_codon:yes gene_type:complete
MFVNVTFLFYVRWLFSKIKLMNEEIQNISGTIIDYGEHLKQIHEMEMFYGDTTIQGLISHTKDLVNSLSDIDFIVNDEDEEEQDIGAEIEA